MIFSNSKEMSELSQNKTIRIAESEMVTLSKYLGLIIN